MIQDIAPHVLHNEFRHRDIQTGDYLIFIKNHQILIRDAVTEGKIELPEVTEENREKYDQVQFLLMIDDIGFYLVRDDEVGCDASWNYVPLNRIRKLEPKWLAFGAASSFHLAEWYISNTYCGICGKPMIHSENERMMHCPDCRNFQYPKICPVVIVGVIHGEKMLLTRYAEKARSDHFALIAGFAEFAETIEQTVKREVMEETGLSVKNLVFYKSQPWAFSSSLLMGFYCELDGSDEFHFDDHELGYAVWADRNMIPEDQDKISLTAEMMTRFKKIGRRVLE